jgi:hypothetical protein
MVRSAIWISSPKLIDALSQPLLFHVDLVE